MRSAPARTLLLIMMLLLLPAGLATAGSTLVVCAPGYPGSTEQAQPTMDAFAEAATAAAGWKAGSLSAVYFEMEETGLARLAGDGADLAMVPLPFYLLHGKELGLQPLLEAVEDHGEHQVWSLVAKKGAVGGPGDLTGWEITGQPGYFPEFVRGAILGPWGSPPAETTISFSRRPLSALRRAAKGEKVAVVLDSVQTAALESLPFGAELEIVTRSAPMPGVILATVSGRMEKERAGELAAGLNTLHESPGGPELLRTMRMTRFRELDTAALESARSAVPLH